MSLLLMLSYPPRILALALLLAPALPAFLATLFCRPGGQRLRMHWYGRGLCQYIWVFRPHQRASAAAAAAAAAPAAAPPPVTTSLIVSGGAWLVTSAAWGWPFLRALGGGGGGHAVVLVNYRQYPWATAAEQVQDVQAALALVRARAASWGGSAAHLQLFGQSAGAHLCALAVAQEALQRSASAAAASPAACGAGGAAALPFASPLPPPTGSAAAATAPAAAAAAAAAAAPPLRHLFLASGVYDLPAALPHLRARGFPAAALRGLFPPPLLAALSPAHLLAQPPPPHPRRTLPPGAHPPTTLFHGAADASVPAAQSRAYAAALAAAGVRCALREAPGQGHTESVLEGPLEGSGEVSECMLAEAREGSGGGSSSRGAAAAAAAGAASPRLPAVLPRWWVRLIRLANPF